MRKVLNISEKLKTRNFTKNAWLRLRQNLGNVVGSLRYIRRLSVHAVDFVQLLFHITITFVESLGFKLQNASSFNFRLECNNQRNCSSLSSSRHRRILLCQHARTHVAPADDEIYEIPSQCRTALNKNPILKQ